MRQRGRRVFVRFLLAAALLAMFFSGIQLWEINQVNEEARRNYADVSTLAGGRFSHEVINTQFGDIPAKIDFEALQTLNADAVAWLYCPNTPLDYPVMKAKDYNWYLYHLPDGSYNPNGTLFLDYHNPQDFSGRLNIIYGHNMNSDAMFSTLINYKSQDYFEEHPVLYLYTESEENYRIELLYGASIAAGQWRERAFMYEENLASLLGFASHNTTFRSGATYVESDRFVVLSTCSFDYNDARFFVVGVMRP